MLVFIVPIKRTKISRYWKLSGRLFERCPSAICNQCNEHPETQFTHPHVHYIEVDFPTSVADPAEKCPTGAPTA